MIYLNTRSANIDYDWFGSKDCINFWKDFEECHFQGDTIPIELYAEINSDDFQIYFGKIPSDKLSRANQNIYARLVCNEKRGSEEAKLFFNLIAYFLDNESNRSEVGKIFEKYFTADFINSLDEKRKNSETDSQISKKISGFLNEIPKSDFRNNGFTISDKIIFDSAEDSKNDFLSLLYKICEISELKSEKIILVFSSFRSESKVTQFTEIIQQKRLSAVAFVLTDKSDFQRKEIDLKKKVQKATVSSSIPNFQKNGKNSPSDLNKEASVQENSSSSSANTLQKRASNLLVLGLALGLITGVILGYKFSEIFSPNGKKVADLESRITKLNEEKETTISELKTELEKKDSKISDLETELEEYKKWANSSPSNKTNKTSASSKIPKYEISDTDEYNLKIVKMVLNGDSEKAKELYNKKEGKKEKIKDAISELNLSDEEIKVIGIALKNDEKAFF